MEDLSTYIQEIARRHKVVLDPNDPILMLHTFFNLFQKDMSEGQKQLLYEFQAVLEEEHAKWDEETKARATRVLTASLEAGKNAMNESLNTGTAEMVTNVKKGITPLFDAFGEQTDKLRFFAMVNVVSSALLLIFVAVLVLFFR